jgi:hypothetical protein
MAALQAQVVKAIPQAPPVQLALYQGKLNDKVDTDKAARHLANFLASCKEEMQLAAQAIGRYAFREIDRSDLVSVDRELAEFIDIRYAGNHRREKQQEQGKRKESQAKGHEAMLPKNLPLQ